MSDPTAAAAASDANVMGPKQGEQLPDGWSWRKDGGVTFPAPSGPTK